MNARTQPAPNEILPAGRRPLSIVVRAPLQGRTLAVWTVAAGVLLAALGLLGYGTGYAYGPVAGSPAAVPEQPFPSDLAAQKRLQRRMESRRRQLLVSLRKQAPRGIHIVVDQTHNRLYLKNDDRVTLEATCSAGSGMILKEGEGGRKWVFDTPRGVFRVRNRVENPVWKKPDWAFVEEGKPIPNDPGERFEYGTLGEYALYLGDGYMIHGTLYERALGRSVTHGCIRLGRDDLRVVWRNAGIGTPVYIY